MKRPLTPAQQDAFNRDVAEALRGLYGQGGVSASCQCAVNRLRTYADHCRGDCGCDCNPYDDAPAGDVPAAAPESAPAATPATTEKTA